MKEVGELKDYEIVDGKEWWVVAIEGSRRFRGLKAIINDYDKAVRIGAKLIEDTDYRERVYNDIIRRGYDPKKLLRRLEWKKLSIESIRRGRVFEHLLYALLRYYEMLNSRKRLIEAKISRLRREGRSEEELGRLRQKEWKSEVAVAEAVFRLQLLNLMIICTSYAPVLGFKRTLWRVRAFGGLF